MTIDITVKIGGSAGQGIQTIGTVIARACRNAGYYIMGINDFESRIRGGHSFFQLRISDLPVSAPVHEIDLLIALNSETWHLYQNQLKAGAMALIDSDDPIESKRAVAVKFTQIAEKVGRKLFANTVAASAALSMLGASFDLIESILTEQFQNKKEGILEENIAAARRGYEAVEGVAFDAKPLITTSEPKGQVMPGSMAFSLGAVASDCRVASFYPMSPATGIMGHLTNWTDKVPLVVEQAEDEIAAINMTIGASFAGVRAMTATSGGGFCLMTEGLGLAGMTETPIVVIDAQRPGPATGLPTRTGQGDLDFVIHASQDDFPRFVFAPGTLEQAFEVTKKAFSLSEKYQVPAIILADQYLVDSLFLLETPFEAEKAVERFIVQDGDLESPKSYERYQVTPSGISPRALPCRGDALVLVSSDEHREDGHISEAIEHRNTMVKKRNAKLPEMVKEISRPDGEFMEAETLLLGWGSTAGALTEGVYRLREKDMNVGYLVFTDLWPFPVEQVADLLSRTKRIIMVEQNSTSQLGRLLRAETGISPTDSILKNDGRPFTPQYIIAAVERMEIN